MSKEFGIYSHDQNPLLWIGARAIFKPYDKYRQVDIPYDRWSHEFKPEMTDEEISEFTSWINDTAMPQVCKMVKGCPSIHKYFESDDGKFWAEFDDRGSCGYLYIGFGTTEKYEQIYNNRKEENGNV